ncbi:trypsin-like peptidase domain-containing protein [Streptomyces sp. NPDC021096]|uniref:trypsin-like peptidase domain-containing protein n=1 Tax=Streptomyces sp. NPDC021096 TaxID=3154792 RepID=UPI0033C553D1
MDEGKARVSGPKPQWWSRRRRNPDDWPLQAPSAPPVSAPGAEAEAGLSAPGTEPVADLPAPGAQSPAGPESVAVADAEASAGPAVPGSMAESVPAPAAHPAPEDAPRPAPTAHPAPEHGGPPGPLHAPDPYGTPPYGRPGPWAPAPPVQRPVVTPPHGTHLPPAYPQAEPPAYPYAGPAPAHGAAGPVPAHAPAGPTPPYGTAAGSTPAHAPAGPTPPPGTAVPTAGPAPATQGPWQYDPWAASAARGAREKAAVGSLTRGRVLAGAVAVALVAGGVGAGIGVYLERDGGGSRVTLPQAAPGKGDRAPGSIAGIAARALPGVVTIHVRGGGEGGTGTGFVLDDKGHILTNNHVVQPAGSDGSISVTFNGGQTAKATLVGRDGGYDLAVIKVSGVSGLTPLPLGNSDSVRVGDSVVAIGAPFDLAGTVTTGIISAKERPITAGGKKQDGSDISYVDALQTDAPINPGNSGGPLMDSSARVIGINSAIRSVGESAAGGQGGSIGLGFAIPVNQAKRVAEELINTGRATHPVIGVSLDMGYAGDGARVNTDSARTQAVNRGGPADKAGIQPKDVIRKVDGVPVHSGQELIVKIRSHRPGDTLTLTVERDGGERTVRLTLGSASTR